MAKKAASPKISKGKEDKDTKRDKGGIETKEEDNDKSNSEAMKPKCINSEQQKPAKDDGDRGQGSMDADDKENNKKRKHEGEDQAEPAGKSSKSNDGEDQPEDNAISPKENEDDGKPKATKPPIDLTKPIKRARTAYFIFSDERRAEIQAKHKGEGVAVVARELGQIWASLSAEEKEVYQEKAALEREQVAQQLEQLKAAGIDLSTLPGAAQPNETSATNALVFPVGRIRKICKLDPEVKNASKEALMLITKCAELVTSKLGIETARVAQIQNRRKLLPEDVAQVCGTREQFLFLRDDVKDLVREQVVQKQKEKEENPNQNNKEGAKSNGKPLTAFFAPVSGEKH